MLVKFCELECGDLIKASWKAHTRGANGIQCMIFIPHQIIS